MRAIQREIRKNALNGSLRCCKIAYFTINSCEGNGITKIVPEGIRVLAQVEFNNREIYIGLTKENRGTYAEQVQSLAFDIFSIRDNAHFLSSRLES